MAAQRSNSLSPFLLALFLTVGGSTAWLVLAGLCGEFLQGAPQAGQIYESLIVAEDGKPLIQRNSGRNYEEQEWLDLENNVIARRAGETVLQAASFARRYPPGVVSHWGTFPQRGIFGFSDGGQPAVYWYLISDDDRGEAVYFAGYNSRTKLPVGYLGAGGFRQEAPTRGEMISIDARQIGSQNMYGAIAAVQMVQQVPVYALAEVGPHRVPGWMVYVISGDRLLEVDLRQRKLRTVLELAGMNGVALIDHALPTAGVDGKDASSARQDLMVRTDDELLVISRQDGSRRTFKLPAEFRTIALAVYELADDSLLVVDPNNKKGQGLMDYRLYWLDPAGQIVKHSETRLQVGVAHPLADQALIAAMFPSPLALLTATTVIQPASRVEQGLEPSYGTALLSALADWWPALLPICVLSAALALLAYRRQRQFALPGGLLWALFVFLAGPPGYFAYLYHRGWPVRPPCPRCQQPAPRDRDNCTECTAPFPLPARKGIEVFA